MRNRNLLLTSILTVIVVGLFGIVLATSTSPSIASATGALPFHSHRTLFASGQHCHELDATRLRLARAYAQITLDLDEDQAATLDPLLDVIRRWHDDAGSLCTLSEDSTAPVLIRDVAALAEKTSAAIADLVPAFDAFYATLTPVQQERLNGWLRDHHGPRS